MESQIALFLEEWQRTITPAEQQRAVLMYQEYLKYEQAQEKEHTESTAESAVDSKANSHVLSSNDTDLFLTIPATQPATPPIA